MTRYRIVVAAAALAVALGVAAAVEAAIPDGAGVIHACYSKSAPPGGQPGALRVIDTAAGQNCQISEGSVNWSQTGPPGPQGPQGIQGPPGPKGDKGDPGANAYFAGTGLTLSGGNTFSISGSYRLPQGCGTNQAPYQTAVPNAWGCFTAANAGESCSAGKFQNGVDANGDVKCGTPASLPQEIWQTTDGFQDTPQGEDTTVATLSLPAGTFLVNASFSANDDIGGNGAVNMYCDFDPNIGSTAWAWGDAIGFSMSLEGIATFASPADVSVVCHESSVGGSDHVSDLEMTAVPVGTLHNQ